jgi:hypothetical protein
LPTTDAGCSRGAGCEYQVNMSQAGLDNFITGGSFKGPATNCMVGGAPVSCAGMEHGPIGNMTGMVTFTPTVPGLYRFFCYYHQSIGMFGVLVVLPNAGYHPASH